MINEFVFLQLSIILVPIHFPKKIGMMLKYQLTSKHVPLVEHLQQEQQAQVSHLYILIFYIYDLIFILFVEIASDALKGRVYEASLGDLIKLDDEDSYRKFRLICEDVQGRHCLTNFHGMDITTDRLRMLVKKWQVIQNILFSLQKKKQIYDFHRH